MIFQMNSMMLWRLVPIGLLVSPHTLGKGHHRTITMSFDPAAMILPIVTQKNETKEHNYSSSDDGKWEIEKVALLKQFRELNDQMRTQKLIDSERASQRQKEVNELNSLVSTLKQEIQDNIPIQNGYEAPPDVLSNNIQPGIASEHPNWWRLAFFICSLIFIVVFVMMSCARDEKTSTPIAQLLTCAPVSYSEAEDETSAALQSKDKKSSSSARAQKDRLISTIREKHDKLVINEESSKATVLQLREQLSALDNEVTSLASQKLENATKMAELEGRIKSENLRAESLVKERDQLKASLADLTVTADKQKIIVESNKKRIADLTKEHEKLSGGSRGLESSIADQKKKAASDAVKILDLKKELAVYQEKEERDQQLLSTIRGQRDELLQTEAAFEQKVVELEERILTLNTEASSLLALKLENEVKLAELEDRVKEGNALVGSLTLERDSIVAAKTILEASYAKQSSWAESSKKLLVDLQSDRDHLHKKSLGLEVVVRALRIESDNKITELEKQLFTQGQKKAESDRELLVLIHEKRDELVMTEEISNIYIQLRKKNVELAALTAAKATGDTRLAQLEDSLKKEKSLSAGLSSEKEQLVESVATLEALNAKQVAIVDTNSKVVAVLTKERDDLIVGRASADKIIKELLGQVETEKAHLKQVLLAQEVRDNENMRNLQCLHEATERKGLLEVTAGELKDQVGELEAQRDRLRVKAAHARFGARQEGTITKPASFRSQTNTAFDLFSTELDGDMADADDHDFDLSEDSDSDNSGVGMGIFTKANKSPITRLTGSEYGSDLDRSYRSDTDERERLTPRKTDVDPPSVLQAAYLDSVSDAEKQKNRVVRQMFRDMDAVTVSDEDENINVNIEKRETVDSAPEKAEKTVNQVTPEKAPYSAFSSMFFKAST
jgi:hypothetical protein